MQLLIGLALAVGVMLFLAWSRCAWAARPSASAWRAGRVEEDSIRRMGASWLLALICA